MPGFIITAATVAGRHFFVKTDKRLINIKSSRPKAGILIYYDSNYNRHRTDRVLHGKPFKGNGFCQPGNWRG